MRAQCAMPVLPLSTAEDLGPQVWDRGSGLSCPVGLGVLTGEISPGLVDEVIERIDAVEASELHELAIELFAGERLSVAGVGTEESVFQEALAPLEVVAS